MAKNNGTGGDDSAESIVAESLGLSPEDLGAVAGEDSFSLDSDITDETVADELGQGKTGEQNVDEFGDDVTHTEPQNNQRQPQNNQQQRQPQNNQQQQRQPQRPLPKNGEVKADAKGNLIRPDGTVAATAGREARYYQEMVKATNAVAQVTQQAQHFQSQLKERDTRLGKAIEIGNGLVTQIDAYKAREKQVTELGVTPEEQLQALTFVAQGKRDPIAAIKGILTLAATRGIDLSTLGVAGADGKSILDMPTILNVVRTEIANATKPVVDANNQQQQERQRTEETAQAQDRLNNHVVEFFNANASAKPYFPIFEAMYKDPALENMPLSEMWLRIQLELSKGGPDPLARKANPNTQQRRALPNGRGGPRAETEQADTSNDINGMAPVSTSFEQIVKDALSIR